MGGRLARESRSAPASTRRQAKQYQYALPTSAPNVPSLIDSLSTMARATREATSIHWKSRKYTPIDGILGASNITKRSHGIQHPAAAARGSRTKGAIRIPNAAKYAAP